MKQLLVVGAVLYALSAGVKAICIPEPVSRLIADANVALVASGVVTNIVKIASGEIVTLRITSVWKGIPGANARVYSTLAGEPRQEDVPQPFESGREYLVTASLLSPAERRALALADSQEPLFGIREGARSCTTSPMDAPFISRILAGTPGRALR